MKAQGSTEYIIILAVVLVIVLVTLTVLGFFSGFAEDSRMGESQSYWANAAQPFSIIDYKLASVPAKLFLKVQNRGNTQLNITGFTVAPDRGSELSLDTSLPLSLQPGGKADIAFSLPAGCEPGKAYEYAVSIAYGTQSVGGLDQAGGKAFIVRCTS